MNRSDHRKSTGLRTFGSLVPRRDFFRGVSLGAGAVLLAPFIKQLKAADGGVRVPARVVFFVQGNGLFPDQIQPEGIDRPSEPDKLEDRPLTGHRFARSIAPLEPFADRMSLIHGLSGRSSLGIHGMGMGALGCFPAHLAANQETVDAALAKSLPALFRHVGLGITSFPSDSVIYNVSAWDRGVPLPTQCNPRLTYQSLFALAAGDTVEQKFAADIQLLDFLADDVRRLQSRLSGFEKEKLGHYLSAFESISNRRSALAALKDQVTAAAPELNANFDAEAFAFQRLEAQFDLAAGALIAGLTNVVTISSGAGLEQTGVSFDGTELGLNAGPIPSHEVGHNQPVQATAADELHIRTRERHCEKLATFVRKLESMPEGDGSMLDNTVIVYLSDSAEAHHPRAYEWPLIVIGDLGGRLKTRNRYLRFPWYGKPGHRTVANFYGALLHAVGDRRERFGLPDQKLLDLDQSGPLEEILA